jgi:penicillin G amidase
MAKKIGKVLFGIIIVLIFLGAVTALVAPPMVRRTAKKSFPAVEGEIQISGLDGPVYIYRDGYGIPHIYATSHQDLFFSQGYVHAQDRFWQMDFWRHMGAGRLAEMVGKPMLETDKFLRTLGWERVAQQELELLGSDELAILEAYSAGVNAYISETKGSDLSLEYLFLGLLNANYEPPPWTPLNTLTWGKAMAWDLRANLDSEIDRAKLLKTLPRNQLEFLYPPYPADHPYIVSDPSTNKQDDGQGYNLADPYHSYLPDSIWQQVVKSLENIQNSEADLDQITGGGFEAIGSNSWAVHGDLTDTGKPYLMNDPHLGSQMPSIWYEIGLHCQDKTEECQLDVTGFSFAGVPGVVIGHNDHIAWGLTNVGPDVMDLYIEKTNPEHPTQYLTPDGWAEMESIIEVIQIAGKDPIEHQVYITSHGPIIGSEYGLDDFDQTTGLAIPENYLLALRWTALEPSCVFCAMWDINLATNWEEFRQAAAHFVVPAQNLIYADVNGNIGYQMPGNIPIRVEGHDGMLPVPGWNGDYEWQGYIPFEELPYSFNPSEGYIVTANNAVVGPDYPYLISEEWNRGFRAQRIVDMLEEAPKPINISMLKTMQGDNYDLIAPVLVPEILKLDFSDPELAAAQEILVGWNYQADLDSAPAALFMTFWQNLINNTIQDNLPGDFHIGVGSASKEIIRQLVNQPENPWWNDASTAKRETMADIFKLTFEESYQELKKGYGKDPGSWQWGKLHTITFQNQVMSSFPFVKKFFNRGPFLAAGGNEIVNATGWDPGNPYVIDWLPSMRMIVDLSDLSNSLSIHTTGQSGHAYQPHYIDMADLWRNIYYHPMLWDTDHIQRQAESLLRLSP